MLLARAATKEDKEKKDGGVAAGPPKKKKQRAMAADDVDRFIHNYLAERAKPTACCNRNLPANLHHHTSSKPAALPQVSSSQIVVSC